MVHGFKFKKEIDVENEKEYNQKIGRGTGDCVFFNVCQSIVPMLRSCGIRRLFWQNSIAPLVDENPERDCNV